MRKGATASSRFAQERIRGAITTMPGGPLTFISPYLARLSRPGWGRRCTSPADRCCRSPRFSIQFLKAPGTAWSRPLICRSRQRSGRSAISSTSSCAARPRHQWSADMARLTPFQTVGPYLHIGLRVGLDTQTAPTSPVVIRGRLLDGKGAGVPDGLLEWWHPSLTTMHRSMTGEDGGFLFEALKPPAIDGPDGSVQAPHFAVRVLARGLLHPYMQRVPEDRRQTLLARPVSASDYRFDVVVQGQNETVFFDI